MNEQTVVGIEVVEGVSVAFDAGAVENEARIVRGVQVASSHGEAAKDVIAVGGAHLGAEPEHPVTDRDSLSGGVWDWKGEEFDFLVAQVHTAGRVEFVWVEDGEEGVADWFDESDWAELGILPLQEGTEGGLSRTFWAVQESEARERNHSISAVGTTRRSAAVRVERVEVEARPRNRRMMQTSSFSD